MELLFFNILIKSELYLRAVHVGNLSAGLLEHQEGRGNIPDFGRVVDTSSESSVNCESEIHKTVGYAHIPDIRLPEKSGLIWSGTV